MAKSLKQQQHLERLHKMREDRKQFFESGKEAGYRELANYIEDNCLLSTTPPDTTTIYPDVVIQKFMFDKGIEPRKEEV